MSSSFLINLRIFGYQILKSLKEKNVRDIDILKLEPYSKCNKKIFSFSITEFTMLAYGHIYHKLYIKKKLSNSYSFSGYRKNVDIIEARRDS